MSNSAVGEAKNAANVPSWKTELDSAMELLEHGKPVNCLTALHAMLQEHGKNDLCRALVFDGMGRALFMDEKPELGLEAFNESLKILRKLYSEQKISASLLLGSAQNLAHALMVNGSLEESLKVAQENVALSEEAFAGDSREVAGALFSVAATLYEMKDYDAAEASLLRAKKILEGLPGEPDAQIGFILNNLGRIYEERGDLANGIDYHRRAVEFRRRLSNLEDLAFSLGNYGVALGTAGELQKACNALEEALVLYCALNLKESPIAQAFAANLELFRNVRNKNSEASDAK